MAFLLFRVMGEMQHLACFLSRHEKTLVIVIGLLLMYTLTCGIFLMNWADHHVNPVAPSHAQVVRKFTVNERVSYHGVRSF